MSKEEKIELEFGVPEHGWLSTTFRCGDFNLELDVSDVPRNPTSQLCDSLIQLLKGINSPDLVPWHLEPYCYYLQIEKLESHYSVAILESDNFESPTRVTFQIVGCFEFMILPMYRSLKEFASKMYIPPHWEEIDKDRIEELKRLVKKKKST